MWRLLILFLAFCFSSFSLKDCAGFDWEKYDKNHGSFSYGRGGIYSSFHPSFEGWLYCFAYRATSDRSITLDENNVYVGKLDGGDVYIGVAYAVDISSLDTEHKEYNLYYFSGGKYNGWYLYQQDRVEITDSQRFIAKLQNSDLSTWDIVTLEFDSSDDSGKVPINPGAGLNIFDYAFSMPRTGFDKNNQSAYYRELFSRADVKGNNKAASPVPLMVDLPSNVSAGRYSENFRIFSSSDFSSFLVEQLRRLSGSYDSDGGGLPDFQEWDGFSSSLVYFWDNPDDDSQYIPGVQRVEVVGGQDVGSLDPPFFDGPPSFQMPEGFDLGPESSDWVQKVTDSVEAVREKLEPLRGRFLPLFNDLENVDPVLRVQFSSDNKTGFVSSIPIDFSFDFSGASLGSSVASSLQLIRSVLVVLIFAVVLWIMIQDITKKEGSKDD